MKKNCPICDKTVISDIGEKNGFHLELCHNCKFMFLLEDFDYSKYYNNFYFKSYYNPKALYGEEEFKDGFDYFGLDYIHRLKYTSVLVFLYKFTDFIDKNYLDVGCAGCTGLEIAQAFGANVYGLDVSQFAIETCKNRFPNVFNGEIHDLEDMNINFDIVTMLDVLEHMKDPKREIKVLSKLVNKNGLVFIDNNVYSYKEFLKNKEYFNRNFEPPYHCSYFSEKNLIKLMENNGFKLIYKKLNIINSFIKIYSFLKMTFNKKYKKKIEKAHLLAEKRQPLTKDLIKHRNFWSRFIGSFLPSGYLFRKK
jgi:2-polyprenyl-3-methyl-5-hydroxy-6-metoxy-1,4-benzoquinol methylase